MAFMASLRRGAVRLRDHHAAHLSADTMGPSVARDVLDRLRDRDVARCEALVGGRWRAAEGGGTFEVRNPATGDVLARVADCGAAEARAAVAAAAAAFPAWSALAAKARAAPMLRWHALVLQARDDLAALMTLESGKPLAESRAELDLGAESISHMAAQAVAAPAGEVVAASDPERRFLVLRQPVGVVGAITPWNFPASMILRKVAPALAAGCPVVLKPSRATPLTALALAELAARAGVPPGVLNVVAGADSAAIGGALLEADAVKKLTFTGSTAVGVDLAARAAPSMKRLSLELGGNAPFVVMADADVAAAARAAAASSNRNAGQTCICANRLLVHESVAGAFTEALAAEVRALRLGSGLDPGVTTGPLISAAALRGVEAKVADAVARGARVVAGGRRPGFSGARSHPLAAGFFYEPTVLAGCTTDSAVYREEVFGPVSPVFTFSSDDEAVAMANDAPGRLAAYVFTARAGGALRLAERLQYGIVGVNTAAVTAESAPFGGWGMAGLGREQGRAGFEAFLEAKTVAIDVGA